MVGFSYKSSLLKGTVCGLLAAVSEAFSPSSAGSHQKQHMKMGNDDNVSPLKVDEKMNSKNRKRIIFIRHGRTFMNDHINGIHYGQPGFTDIFEDTEENKRKFYDSPLSPRGEKQVSELHDKLRRLSYGDSSVCSELHISNQECSFLDEIDLVVTSPLTRALQTMHFSLFPFIKSRDIPVVAVPQAAERIFLVADIGRARRDLKQEYPYVDFKSAFPKSMDEDDEWHYIPSAEERRNYVEWRPNGEGQLYGCLGEPQNRFERRMEELMDWLDSRPEATIAVVCHAGVILWFLGDVFENCHLRVVDMDDVLNPKRLYEAPKEQASKIK